MATLTEPTPESDVMEFVCTSGALRGQIVTLTEDEANLLFTPEGQAALRLFVQSVESLAENTTKLRESMDALADELHQTVQEVKRVAQD